MGPITTTVSILVFLFYCPMNVHSGVSVRRPPDLVRNTRNIHQMTLPHQQATLYSRYFLADKLAGSKRMASGGAPLLARSEKLPAELDLMLDDDEPQMDLPKRFDDYGHMRFGKRGNGGGDDTSDDYGHMRFGKRGGD